MAKSIRSKIKRKHRTERRVEYAPTADARQETRAVRMSAYVARRHALKLAGEGKEIPAEMAKAAAHADELDIADDQAREKVAKGQFFFLHPNSKIRTVPVIPDPTGIPAFRGSATVAALSAAEEQATLEQFEDGVRKSTYRLEQKRAADDRKRALREEALRRQEEKRAAEKAASTRRRNK